MSTTEHADLEALSAFVDGEAPEWADHVAGCEECRAAAAGLGAVAAAVRAPVDPPAEAVRERAIAAALEAASAEARHEAERARFARRRAPRPWAMPAVAAAVVMLLALSGVVLSANRATDNENTTLAGPALQDAKTESGVAGAAPNAPPADLGDVTDPHVLRRRAGFPVGLMAATDPSVPAGVTVQRAETTEPGNTGAPAVAPPTTTLSQRAATPVPVGTRPCEEQARAREPGLGPVVYFATARRGDVPAYVVGFSPVGARDPVTLLLLSQAGCSELLRSVGPGLP